MRLLPAFVLACLLPSVLAIRCQCTTSTESATCHSGWCEVGNRGERRGACGLVRAGAKQHYACIRVDGESEDECKVDRRHGRMQVSCFCRSGDYCNLDLEDRVDDEIREPSFLHEQYNFAVQAKNAPTTTTTSTTTPRPRPQPVVRPLSSHHSQYPQRFGYVEEEREEIVHRQRVRPEPASFDADTEEFTVEDAYVDDYADVRAQSHSRLDNADSVELPTRLLDGHVIPAVPLRPASGDWRPADLREPVVHHPAPVQHHKHHQNQHQEHQNQHSHQPTHQTHQQQQNHHSHQHQHQTLHQSPNHHLSPSGHLVKPHAIEGEEVRGYAQRREQLRPVETTSTSTTTPSTTSATTPSTPTTTSVTTRYWRPTFPTRAPSATRTYPKRTYRPLDIRRRTSTTTTTTEATTTEEESVTGVLLMGGVVREEEQKNKDKKEEEEEKEEEEQSDDDFVVEESEEEEDEDETTTSTTTEQPTSEITYRQQKRPTKAERDASATVLVASVLALVIARIL